jgi:hypothetical protein
MRSRATSSMLRMTFFSILTSCDSFRARSGPKAPAAFLRKAWPIREQSATTIPRIMVFATIRARVRVRVPVREPGAGCPSAETIPARSGSTASELPPFDWHTREARARLIVDDTPGTTSVTHFTHPVRPFRAIGWSWSWTMEAGGSRPARRSGRATGAWNRCGAWWTIVDRGGIEREV